MNAPQTSSASASGRGSPRARPRRRRRERAPTFRSSAPPGQERAFRTPSSSGRPTPSSASRRKSSSAPSRRFAGWASSSGFRPRRGRLRSSRCHCAVCSCRERRRPVISRCRSRTSINSTTLRSSSCSVSSRHRRMPSAAVHSNRSCACWGSRPAVPFPACRSPRFLSKAHRRSHRGSKASCRMPRPVPPGSVTSPRCSVALFPAMKYASHWARRSSRSAFEPPPAPGATPSSRRSWAWQ